VARATCGATAAVGMASERRTKIRETDIAPQIYK
jgi:hypothetical protein